MARPSPLVDERAPWGLGDMLKAIGIVVVGTIVISIVSALIAILVAGDLDLEEDPTALTIVLLANAVLEIVLLTTAAHFSLRKYGARWRDLGLRWPQRGGFWSTIGLAIGLVIGGMMMNGAYFVTLASIGVEPDTDLPKAYFDNIGPVIAIGVISLAFAPFMEEIFFRGFIFGGLRARWGLAAGALGSGLLFSLAHIGNPGALYLVPPIAAIGALFALGYAYSGSLVAVMCAHVLFNSISFAGSIANATG